MNRNINQNFLQKNEGNNDYPNPYLNNSSNYEPNLQINHISNQISSMPERMMLFNNPILREPTSQNPMMNVMPLDYDNTQLFNGNEVPNFSSDNGLIIESEINDNFNKGLFQNADELLWNRGNSQRQYYSAPVNSVPSNQNEYSQWLYGSTDGICKQGSVFMNSGVKYTSDSLLCNGNNVASPTNFGILDSDNLMSSVQQNY